MTNVTSFPSIQVTEQSTSTFNQSISRHLIPEATQKISNFECFKFIDFSLESLSLLSRLVCSLDTTAMSVPIIKLYHGKYFVQIFLLIVEWHHKTHCFPVLISSSSDITIYIRILVGQNRTWVLTMEETMYIFSEARGFDNGSHAQKLTDNCEPRCFSKS